MGVRNQSAGTDPKSATQPDWMASGVESLDRDYGARGAGSYIGYAELFTGLCVDLRRKY
jgi:hypothetical protein